MVIFVYGTTGELIKIVPLLKIIPRQQYILINTVQQANQLPKLQEQFGIKDDFLLGYGYKGRDLENYFQAIRWLPIVSWNFFRLRKKIKLAIKNQPPSKNILIVHGDTNTTVVGSFFGKLLRLKVAHIEAGLRSFDLLHPFPEEINRRIASKLVRVHFAPGDQPVKNLSRAKGIVVNTMYNTVKDSLNLVQNIKTIELPDNLPKHYGIVSIHRNELLSNKRALLEFLQVLNTPDLSEPKLVFLDHPVTRERLRALNYDHYLEKENIVRIPKLDYPRFLKLLSQAKFVLTDSGGLQEECTYLNIPCVVHRKVTERLEGLGTNVELTGLDAAEVPKILKVLLKRTKKINYDETSPTTIIMNYLRKEGYISLPR
jgi:UDP-N-acetylglucosamine 2-epimerase (non-hydrolysing)